MAKSKRKIQQLTNLNPNSLTHYEISGNDRKKALELLEQCKKREQELKNKKDETKK